MRLYITILSILFSISLCIGNKTLINTYTIIFVLITNIWFICNCLYYFFKISRHLQLFYPEIYKKNSISIYGTRFLTQNGFSDKSIRDINDGRIEIYRQKYNLFFIYNACAFVILAFFSVFRTILT